MKHNQFKAIINKMLKDKCKEQELILSGVDITNSEKHIYVYNNQWDCKLAIRLWINDKQIHLSATTDMTKPVGIGNRQFDVTCSYTQFYQLNAVVNTMFATLKI